MSVHFSSKSSEWATPTPLFDKLNEEFGFTLDPCATAENAKCQTYFTREQSGLQFSWDGHTVFMNPPYGSEIKSWTEKAYTQSLSTDRHEGVTVVCLVPARTDTAWWHDYAMKGEVRFIRGRIKFNGHKNSAPFPSALVIFQGAKRETMKASTGSFSNKSESCAAMSDTDKKE